VWDDLRKILPGCQQMVNVPNGVETLPKISIAWVGCTNVTDRRQTKTDGRWHIANVNVNKWNFLDQQTIDAPEVNDFKTVKDWRQPGDGLGLFDFDGDDLPVVRQDLSGPICKDSQSAPRSPHLRSSSSVQTRNSQTPGRNNRRKASHASKVKDYR